MPDLLWLTLACAAFAVGAALVLNAIRGPPMRDKFPESVEKARERSDQRFHSEPGERHGLFRFVSPVSGATLRVIVCDAELHEKLEHVAEGWDHVSVSKIDSTPRWEEMQFVKELFFDDEECVMQLHPPKSDYINQYPHCLHLWKPSKTPIPVPPKVCV